MWGPGCRQGPHTEWPWPPGPCKHLAGSGVFQLCGTQQPPRRRPGRSDDQDCVSQHVSMYPKVKSPIYLCSKTNGSKHSIKMFFKPSVLFPALSVSIPFRHILRFTTVFFKQPKFPLLPVWLHELEGQRVTGAGGCCRNRFLLGLPHH